MGQVIVWKKNGRVMVTSPAPGIDIDRAIRLSVPTGEPYQVVDAKDVPQDKAFRNAWTFNGAFGIDMAKAREIHRDKIRTARKPIIADLDVKFMLALEKGQSTADVAAKKQALRDAPADPAIDAAKTAEELRAVWPECLKG